MGSLLPTHGPARDCEALEETLQGWRRAYANEPATKPERALVLVGHLFAEGDGEREAPPVVGVRVG